MRHLVLVASLVLAGCADQAPVVPAIVETPPVNEADDAADDPAIWVASDDAARSVVIATQKQGGLYVYDLGGATIQDLPGGEPNNVDLRDGFGWPEGASPIVGASDRTDNSLVFWRFDPATRLLDSTPRARIATGFTEVYGFCIGRMAESYVVIATDRDSGEVGVWRLALSPDGAVSGERIANFTLGSIAEGCVIDDEAGVFYIAQELEGIWRVALDDADGSERRAIDTVGQGGNLVADVEGLSLWLGPNGGGYLVASVQGASRFAVYNRSDNAYRGAFRIGPSADGGVDGVNGTDGIDVTAAALGPVYPQGLLVVQDDENTNPNGFQNFKYVSWADVVAALGLD